MLNYENYHSKENNLKYLSCSQYKNFIGTIGKPGCESRTMAEIYGLYEREKGIDLYIGQYVDNHFAGTLDQFKVDNPVIFKKDGELKAPFLQANDLIKKAEADNLFMQYMNGRKQVIMTAKMFGAEWKIAIDSYIEDLAIVDLKIMKSIRKTEYVQGIGRISFVEYWGYDIQMAIYQKVVEINTGKKLPVYLACLSKEKSPDIELISINQKRLDDVLLEVKHNTGVISALKSGEIESKRCDICDFCKETKVLKEVINYEDLI